MKQKYAALFFYAGTDYCGWQRQKHNQAGSAANGRTSIQQTIEESLAQITGEKPSVVGSGRTDSGVHSAGQVAHFSLEARDWDPQILMRGLNSQLPGSIRAADVQKVSSEFHAQRCAERKQYSYYFQQGSSALPHLEPYTRWMSRKLDIESMQAAINHLLGEHDFKGFQASGAKPGPTVRRILEAEVTLEKVGFPLSGFDDNRLVRVRLIGTGFLKQMVRGIAGTLLQVGEGRRKPEVFSEIIATMDRALVGPTAPARALWLERVWYPDQFGITLTGGAPFR